MEGITDEYMQGMLANIKPYCMVLLKPVGNADIENKQQILWEHGRRNFSLRAEGKISIVAPVTREADVAGLYIFNVSEEEASEILKDDPAVKAGILEYATYPCLSFPGDSLK